MEADQSPTIEPQFRALVACPRSGSSLLVNIFAELSVHVVSSNHILEDDSSSEVASTDDSTLEEPSNHEVFGSAKDSGKCCLISKEDLEDRNLKLENLYDAQIILASYESQRPVLLIRDPIRVFASWKSLDWTDAQNLIDYYTSIFRMFHEAPANTVLCLLYEKLVRDPRTEITRICAHWRMTFSDSMLSFEKQPGCSSFLFSNACEKSNYSADKSPASSATVDASKIVDSEVPYHNLLSNSEKDHIEQHLGRLYIECWKEDVLRLRAIVAGKSWFGFDLDDTLHEFRRSSGIATSKVLKKISDQYLTPVAALKDEYSKILKEKTSNAFSDGKASFDYRKERFTALLACFAIPENSSFVDELLDVYEDVLTEALELKSGALDLLVTLKGMGKKIVIITEGPQDVQERTLQALGIKDYVDFLATTNNFRAAKTRGLFPEVLHHLGISAGDLAYVGDSEDRDTKPAMAEGIFSFLLAEAKNVSLSSSPPRVNTLRKLQYIVSDEVA
ncbi:hypothetical protein VTL71DRAFT_13276 [Oculimacula yallundae]|uniref:Uncharacterized protein n=1 Tax=Oculimacula yallundae TaxID=86028 RepID=A0ABR4CJW7_9HELO